MRRLSGIEPRDAVSKGVVERIGLPRCQAEGTDAGLKRRAVAKIEPGKQRCVIAGEGERRGPKCRGNACWVLCGRRL